MQNKSGLLFPLFVGLLAGLTGMVEARDVPFSSQRTITTGANGAQAVYAADIDGDGDCDVLSASAYDDRIAWYENTDGEGTFGSQQTISSTMDFAASVRAADLDGDGDLDVIAASSDDDRVAWFENTDGKGTFGSRQTISTNSIFAKMVFAADMDGDGDSDILSASAVDDTVAWFENRLNEVSADFGPEQVISTVASVPNGPYAVVAADMDGDGDMDVLSASTMDDRIALFENTDGLGTAFTRLDISLTANGARSVWAADVDRDGDLDVFSASRFDDRIAWYENRLDEITADFGPQQTISTGADGAHSVYATDVDGDGDVDVLSASLHDDRVAWYENTNGVGTFSAQKTISTAAVEARFVFAADIDGDGDTDVLSASEDDDRIAWYENETIHRSALFADRSTISTNAQTAFSVRAADIDGDGDQDVLSASLNDDRVAWYENTDGLGTFGAQQTISQFPAGATSVFAADIDGDGDMDALSASAYDNRIAWYENTNGTGTFGALQTITTNAAEAQAVYAADIDGDGDHDVLSASLADDQIAWYENADGAGTFGLQQIITINADGARDVVTADLDGDGDLDVISASSIDDRVAWYENTDGLGAFGVQNTVNIGVGTDGAFSVFAADVDKDGDPDIISGSFSDNSIAWYENRLNELSADFGPLQVISTAAIGPQSVFAGDFDMDGDIDVLSASRLDDRIAWYENTDGQGTFGPQSTVATDAQGAYSVFASDIDGDGDPDALSASFMDSRIAWYENVGGQFALATMDTAPATLHQGQMADMLKITATHRGRSGDTDLELSTFELLFEETEGDPLTSAEANAIIENLLVYLDSGNGLFGAGDDTLVSTVSTLALDGSGVQTVAFTDSDPNVQIAAGDSADFFVVVELTSDAMSQTPNTFQITHQTESTSTAEDRDNDIALLLERAENTTSGNTQALPVVVDCFLIE